jgi:16S rRNA (guanine(966)-N(2))-methyltransferase RsmD
VRIVSGKYKGRIFRPPKSIRARPTTDFAKENLFNILENRLDFENASALDLFSGTGNISFELVSRGCPHVTAVEKQPKHIAFIHRVIGQLDIDNLKVLKKDAFRFLRSTGETYDLIFADPPYQLKGAEEIPGMVFSHRLLKPGGLLILEHDKNLTFPEGINVSEQRKYGTVHFSFFSLLENQA